MCRVINLCQARSAKNNLVLSRGAAPQWRSCHRGPKADAFCRVIRGRADGISPRRQNALHLARRSCRTVKQLDASAFYAHTVLQYAPRCALPQPRLRGAGCGENKTPFSFGIALVLGIDVIEAHVCPTGESWSSWQSCQRSHLDHSHC